MRGRKQKYRRQRNNGVEKRAGVKSQRKRRKVYQLHEMRNIERKGAYKN